ncbi:MAG TPA: glycoside-pentoside-hexuronide (GPH):cation symporter [Candidatus Monoglobus merdigallinarum]|uniref:Glycoside-pentoside-hexuronide (GPH):cation symporter n=1 Tax=Candidatus Monoglobus merdigallinarum TaxID=2838698 RepID=A0A9D1PR79_9FIRM|nr:glycoside-pentoside-hexuronide (GPH):cation symporter [Candidatus Monoglobus merdigallinarum]
MEKNVRPFGMRDKIGYLFGDFGNDFTFIFASSFLMVFYTRVLGISGAAVGTLFVIARFVDAVTDVTMGRIVDMAKPTKDGKFKPWIMRMCGPVAISSFLIYQGGLANASMTVKIIYMYITYLLWGSVFYTSINIPYGSMAAAITPEASERASLSTYRNAGATLASLTIGVITPLIIYTSDSAGNQIIRSNYIFTIIAGVFSVLAVICYIICYRLCTERVRVEKEAPEKSSALKALLRIVKNRALWGIIIAAVFLLLSQLVIASMNNYLYPDYFRNASAISAFTLISSLVVLLIVTPLSVRLSAIFGKKELATVSMLFSGAVYLLLFFMKVKNEWLYLALSSIGYIGLGFFNAVIWANITDVTDYQEVMTYQREDGTVYAVYSFARKLGQALAGGIGGWALTIIGYDNTAPAQTPEVLNGLYTTSTLIPAICFILVAATLAFVYPLSKKRVLKNTEELKKRRGTETSA